jgi:hypothetical protein
MQHIVKENNNQECILEITLALVELAHSQLKKLLQEDPFSSLLINSLPWNNNFTEETT